MKAKKKENIQIGDVFIHKSENGVMETGNLKMNCTFVDDDFVYHKNMFFAKRNCFKVKAK